MTTHQIKDVEAMKQHTIKARFFFDIVCPYAYLASTQMQRLAEETGAEIEWVPMLLGGVFRSIGAPQVPAAAMTPPKARMNTLDLERWAKRWGVPFSFSRYHPQRSVEAMRLLCITPQRLIPAVASRIFRVYWSEQGRVDLAVLEQIAADFGLLEDWRSKADEAKKKLFDYTEVAVRLGIFGAPALEVKGEIFWGQDRLGLARRALGAAPSQWSTSRAPEGSYVEVFHDFSSPFSYLGCQRIEGLVKERGARVEWRPMLLGALFKSIGAPNVPLFAMTDTKRKYMLKDLHDWAAYWGVPFMFPDCFPLRTVTALRLAIIEPTLTPHFYRAVWGDGSDIGDDETIRSILHGLGYEADQLLAETKSASVKERLRENTAAAEALGAFGAPSYALHRPGEPTQLFWGQDRVELLCEALIAD